MELACLTPSAQCILVNFNSFASVEVEKSLGNKLPVAAHLLWLAGMPSSGSRASGEFVFEFNFIRFKLEHK